MNKKQLLALSFMGLFTVNSYAIHLPVPVKMTEESESTITTGGYIGGATVGALGFAIGVVLTADQQELWQKIVVPVVSTLVGGGIGYAGGSVAAYTITPEYSLDYSRRQILAQEQLIAKILNTSNSEAPLHALYNKFRNGPKGYANLDALDAIETALSELYQAERELTQVEDTRANLKSYCDRYREVTNNFKTVLRKTKEMIQNDASYIPDLKNYQEQELKKKDNEIRRLKKEKDAGSNSASK